MKKGMRNMANKKKKKAKNANNKVIKLKTGLESKNLIHTNKLRALLILTILIFIFLVGRIGFIQFVQGNSLKEGAYQQQTINQIISPKRGNIYDSTGKALAIGAQVDTVTINPTKIVKSNEVDTKDYKEKVAKGLSEIFDLNYDEILEKVSSKSQVETIIKKVEQEKVDQLKQWMEENKIMKIQKGITPIVQLLPM